MFEFAYYKKYFDEDLTVHPIKWNNRQDIVTWEFEVGEGVTRSFRAELGKQKPEETSHFQLEKTIKVNKREGRGKSIKTEIIRDILWGQKYCHLQNQEIKALLFADCPQSFE